MKNFLLALCLVLTGITLSATPTDADARRLGGGKAAGMQRQMPANTNNATPNAPPTNNAAAPMAGAAAGTAAAAGKRSWMGPIAGLAAGLGIAALLSHFGMGEGLANMVTMALIAAAAFFAIRWLLGRFAAGRASPQAAAGGMQFAGAGAPSGRSPAAPSPFSPKLVEPAFGTPANVTASGAGALAATTPEGFDAPAFTRIAKLIFIRMQAANDAAQLDDLRKFTTPELFASLRLDLQERGAAAQQTDVVQLDAEVLDTAKEDGQWIVSVRFHGLIREQAGAAAEPFNELWHLVKPIDGERDWAIAGITPIH